MSERSVLQVLQPEDGGVAEHVLRLSRGLSERGWAVEVAVGSDSAISEPLAEAGIEVHRLPLVRAPGAGDLRAAAALRALDRHAGYRLVHAHSSKAGALARASLPRRRRLVYTPHCFAFAAQLGRARLAYRAVEQALVPRSGAIVAVCDWERRLAERELVGAGRLTRVIHNGVEAPRCRDAAPELMEFKGDLPLAGLVSVLRPQKDPMFAVRAAARLAPDTGRFAIVGNGELAGEVRAEIRRLGAGSHVRWFPFEGGVGRYLAALDLFVLSSAWEAFPLSVVEAMAFGLPVLAASVGGVPEAVEDGRTGRLFPVGDQQALVGGMRELLGSVATRERMGVRGLAVFERRFRAEAMVDAVAGLYDELSQRLS